MDLGLNERIVFVAGSSRGIGLATASAFLREGAKVVITGRQEKNLAEARNCLTTQAHPDRILSCQGDITEEDDVRRALDRTMAAFGRLDAVVANIGSGSGRVAWDLSRDEWQAALQVNFLGAMLLVRASMPYLLKSPGTSFTFIASIAGHESITAPVTYGAAKAAVLSGMKALSRLVGHQGVRINAVAPGNVLVPGGVWERKSRAEPEWLHQYLEAEVPLRRLGQPEEIAEAVVFLASARASFITGACLVVDGGQTRSL